MRNQRIFFFFLSFQARSTYWDTFREEDEFVDSDEEGDGKDKKENCTDRTGDHFRAKLAKVAITVAAGAGAILTDATARDSQSRTATRAIFTEKDGPFFGKPTHFGVLIFGKTFGFGTNLDVVPFIAF